MPDWDDPTTIYNQFATPYQIELFQGPATAGRISALILYGGYLILHAQYVTSPLYRRSSWAVKTVLWAVFAFLLGHMGLVIAGVALYTILNRYTYLHLRLGYKFESFMPLTAALVAAPVQGLLAIRAAALLRTNLIRIALCIVFGTAIVFSLVSGILTTVMNFWAMFLWSATGIDILISLALAITLKARVAGFSAKTDGLLHKLIVSALQTASYTAVLSLVGAACSAAFNDISPYVNIPAAFWTQLPVCYGISLYTTLSTRRTVEGDIGRGNSAANRQAIPVSMYTGCKCTRTCTTGVNGSGHGLGRRAGGGLEGADPVMRARTRELERKKREVEEEEADLMSEREKADEERLTRSGGTEEMV
ncbi:hypothetical protein JCM11251_002280 [Rhodosporidiobolus azoricus]